VFLNTAISQNNMPIGIAGTAINESIRAEPANAGMNPAPVSKSDIKKRIAARNAFITAPITHIKRNKLENSSPWN
jgi:hypothetical protein